jgi:hypothetical protein
MYIAFTNYTNQFICALFCSFILALSLQFIDSVHKIYCQSLNLYLAMLNLKFGVINLCAFKLFPSFRFGCKVECFISRNIAQLASVKIMKRAGSHWQELNIHHR